ncbi:MAG: hypothetical protein NXH73_02210 [Flavobacteriaceae bacterium]|nr:hypothetical protein [Flavobacteriaceae bacterium]
MKKNLFIAISVSIFFFSCQRENEKSTPILSEVQFPEMENSSLPYLYSDGNDLLISFVSEIDSLATLYYSRLSDDSWSTPEVITSGTDWFVNWADYPQIAKNGENYIAHILQKSDEATYAYDVMVTQKEKGGLWSTPFKIHSDTTISEHGFVAYTPFGESQFLVNWLDGRNTSGGHNDHNGGPMTLRAAIVNPNGSLDNEFLLDKSVCDCCQTSSAMTANGPVVVYRDRSDEEIRDISIVRFEDGKWSAPVSVHNDNWQIHGCPVNGPRVAAQGETVAVAWFTAAGMESKVNLAFSKNAGIDFDIPIRIDSGNPLGRVAISIIDSEKAVVCWVEDYENELFIKFRTVNVNGKLGEVITVTSIDDSRATGFPQMTVFQGYYFFVWTDFNVNTNLTSVKIARLKFQ